MKHKIIILALSFSLTPLLLGAVEPPLNPLNPLKEYRHCREEPLRTKGGDILRRRDVLQAFRSIHPCPSTGLHIGRCPGWYMDHIWPLANGGCDAVHNIQWLPGEIKTCAGDFCKDRWERRIYRPPTN